MGRRMDDEKINRLMARLNTFLEIQKELHEAKSRYEDLSVELTKIYHSWKKMRDITKKPGNRNIAEIQPAFLNIIMHNIAAAKKTIGWLVEFIGRLIEIIEGRKEKIETGLSATA